MCDTFEALTPGPCKPVCVFDFGQAQERTSPSHVDPYLNHEGLRRDWPSDMIVTGRHDVKSLIKVHVLICCICRVGCTIDGR